MALDSIRQSHSRLKRFDTPSLLTMNNLVFVERDYSSNKHSLPHLAEKSKIKNSNFIYK